MKEIEGLSSLFWRLDLERGVIEGGVTIQRRLSDLRGCFADEAAYAAALAQGDPVIYTVSTIGPVPGEGRLHGALGMITPGRVGAEYHLTRGHLHAWRLAAEIYLGLRGQGVMLLEDEATGESEMVPLLPHSAVYVPGFTAHRTINTGDEPLVYLGIYPAEAGHDYEAVAKRNFRQVVVAVNGRPALLDRAAFLATLGRAIQASPGEMPHD